MNNYDGIVDNEQSTGGTFYGLGVENALANQVADLRAELEAKNKQIASHDATLEMVRNDRDHYRGKYDTLVTDLKDTIVQMVEHSGLDHDHAKNILDACSIEATKTINIEGTITFSGSVELSIFDEFDKYELYSDLSMTYGNESIYDLSYDVDEADESLY